MTINMRLKLARIAQALTQRALGERLGIKELEVSRIETGRARPTPELKKRIAEVLGKQPFEIFDN
jgi:transcriptional regulator with XRE-family HTH domain